MPKAVLMPAISPSTEKASLVRWLKSEGDPILQGEVIAEIESDKATIEVEAEIPGVLSQILIEAGTKEVAVNSPIAVITAAGEPPGSMPAFSKPDTPQLRLSLRNALRLAIHEEMQRDATVFAVMGAASAALGDYGVHAGLREEFGADRVLHLPDYPNSIAGFAAGAAMAGLRPVAEFASWDQCLRAADQIFNAAANTHYISGGRQSVPAVFRGSHGASFQAAAQHSQNFAAWFMHCPGLKLAAPSTPNDAKGLLKAAIRDPNPVIILEGARLYEDEGDVPEDPGYVLPLGEATITIEGHDVTIIAFSAMVKEARRAAEILMRDGISAEVIDLRSLRPLDTKTILKSVKKTHRLVCVDEGWPSCGVGAEITSLVMEQAFDALASPIARIAAADVPMPYAANLEQLALPCANDIAAAAKTACRRVDLS